MDGSAKNIRQFRKARGWTQAQLAALLSIDSVTVSRWERGIASPRRRHLAVLEEFSAAGADRREVEQFSDDASIDELIRFVGVEPARRALRKMALLKRSPTPVRFLIDPTTRLREVDAALYEQNELINNAKIG